MTEVPTLPTSPEALLEASPLSINELAILDPERMSDRDELAYIEQLRAYRVRYEKAIGEATMKRKATKAVKQNPRAALGGITFGDVGEGEDLL